MMRVRTVLKTAVALIAALVAAAVGDLARGIRTGGGLPGALPWGRHAQARRRGKMAGDKGATAVRRNYMKGQTLLSSLRAER